MKSVKYSTKFILILVVLIILPNSVTMIMYDTGNTATAYLLILIFTTATIILLIPLSHLLTYIIINKDLSHINQTLAAAKKEDYSGYFILPLQKNNEDEITKLKRNINWLLHAVSTREDALHSKLEKEKTRNIEFKQKSYIDSLTQVYNRRYFDETVNYFISTSSYRQTNLSLIMIDCDNFKAVNDTFGHQAGDSILKVLGTILAQTTRNTEDYPFRYGGDEFGILIMNAPAARVIMIAEEISSKFTDQNEYSTTLSIGIASGKNTPSSSINVEELKKLADQALYEAKESGRNAIKIQHWSHKSARQIY